MWLNLSLTVSHTVNHALCQHFLVVLGKWHMCLCYYGNVNGIKEYYSIPLCISFLSNLHEL